MREIIKLGSIVTDTATGLEGMVTNLHIELNQMRHYAFQPRGLNPETGAPVKRLWIVPERLKGGTMVPEPSYTPLHVLGTEVEDMASGFKGTAVALVLHMTGCFHVAVQPKGRIEKNGSPIDPVDFDIRRLKGPALPPMTEEERAQDQEKKPSPLEVEPFSVARE